MAEENLNSAGEQEGTQATDAESSLSRQEQARKSEEGGETVRAKEEELKAGPGPDAESIFQKKEAGAK